MEMAKGTGVKVIAGAGSNDTETALKKAKFAKEVGADAILVVTPYYNLSLIHIYYKKEKSHFLQSLIMLKMQNKSICN